MQDELNPCPFCGSRNIDAEGWRNSEGVTGPACDDCGASAGSVSQDSTANIAAWNTRSPAEICKGDEWKSLSVTAIAAENTSVAEYVGSLEARIAELEATLRSAQ